jgi:transposase
MPRLRSASYAARPLASGVRAPGDPGDPCGFEERADSDGTRSPSELYDLFRDLDRRIASFDKKIERIFRASEPCQRIAKIKGVGPKTATAVIAAISDGSEFKNGRHFAAWVGLVPRQHSSGDRKVLMGISKRGNQHLRSLLVHGARAVVRTALSKTDPNNEWVNQLRERRGFNRATVAIANKNARIIWAVLRTGEAYSAAH